MATKQATTTTADAVLKRPLIPDLRFEYSYLRSIKPFIHCRSKRKPSKTSSWTLQQNKHITGSDLSDSEESYARVDRSGAVLLETKKDYEEGIVIHWRNVIWITVRDQIILPFIQGALWGLASYWAPSVVQAGGRVRDILKPKKEGAVVSGLRSWVQRFGRGGHAEERSR
ncbi:hypothetical protein JOM56_000266 [Amanita muscaria]|uniref:Uncharacterized protein n=1 Tax=Amanita muscaria (strain Koide BX008) TaxID=946122 RepID=A0A0C2SSV6_AMAMK|nr:hypothetical protein M378DRAFT_172148 [Amanita muscaria Koide BX008]